MRAVFIRHAESTANAGFASQEGVAGIPITNRGQQEARSLANSLAHRPNLIVLSPFLRTRQTADPTIAKYPSVPQEFWPIQEFTYLNPKRWDGTLPSDRVLAVAEFWQRADPNYRDGGEAESFSEFFCRARDAMQRLEQLPEASLVYLFGHGQFMHMIRSQVLHPTMTLVEHMRGFAEGLKRRPIRNAEMMNVLRTQTGWTIAEPTV